MALTWTGRSSPFDADGGYGWRVIWVEELALFIATGYTASGTQYVAVTSPDGIVWTGRGVRQTEDPPVEVITYENGPGGPTRLSDVAWSPELGLLLAVYSEGSCCGLYASEDGINWSPQANPLVSGGDYGNLTSIAWSPSLNVFVAVGIAATSGIVTNAYSSDGFSWTIGTVAYAGWTIPGDGALTVVWLLDPALFVIGGNDNGGITTSPDGIIWTNQDTPFDDSVEKISGISYQSGAGQILACCIEQDGEDNERSLMYSADSGATWTAVDTPYGSGAGGKLGYAFAIGKVGSTWLLNGMTWDDVTTIAESADGTTGWTSDATPFGGGGFGSGIASNGSIAVVVGQGSGDGPAIATANLAGFPSLNCEFSL